MMVWLASRPFARTLQPFMPISSLFSRRTVLAGSLVLAALAPVQAQHQLAGAAYVPKLASASDEGVKAIKRFQLPPGWKCELWAAEPDLAQPVSFYMDDTGKVYVCETFRHSQGVDDIRGHGDWLDEELASKTVEDRIALLRRHYNNNLSSYTQHTERVRLLQDTKGLGKADRSVVYAEGFNQVLDGIAAGILARGQDVYLANIPHLWRLRDTNGDGVADERKSLSYGYGVRGGFLGHDLHGLAWGPDGRLYFSIGDRAGNVLVDGHYVGNPDCGAVFRCNADGSGLEVYCYGLRNPQELAFDDFGNLFTGDNNSDGGDQARWVYLVENSDNGWRIGYQFIEGSAQHEARGPWNAEKMWAPKNPEQPLYVVPPIANIASGPSGVSYYPGTGGPEYFKGTFTLADFRGSSGGSGIHRFKLKPKGASFELIEADKMIWSILATDGDWGPDSAFYVLDWVEGWNQNGKGRIYKLTHEEGHKNPVVESTRQLLAEGFEKRSRKDLLGLLAHPNQRVRQNAQFQLASMGNEALESLLKVAKANDSLHARVHALWAIGQINRQDHPQGARSASLEMSTVISLLADPADEVRANAARVLSDAVYPGAYDALVKALSDPNPRVVSLAALAVGKLAQPGVVPTLLDVAHRLADTDPVVRHGVVMALTRCASTEQLAALATHEDESVRLVGLLALRRLQSSEIARFLSDKSPRLVLEAARAINDEPIAGALAELARLDLKGVAWGPLFNRVVNANYRHGTDASAKTLASIASTASFPEKGRVDALNALTDWPANNGRDRVTGIWRATAFPRDAKAPRAALKEPVSKLLAGGPTAVRMAALHAVVATSLTDASAAVSGVALDTQADGKLRAEALRTLAALHAPDLGDVLARVADDANEDVRKTALGLSAQVQASSPANPTGPTKAASDPMARIIEVMNKGSIGEKQSALATAASIPGAAADQFLTTWMESLLAGKVAPELALDVLDAALRRTALKPLVARWEASLPKVAENDINPWKVCLLGGNAAEGRKVFYERAEVSCLRCHKVKGDGGEVGPELTGIIGRHDREYILTSILYPNAAIAQGFETALVSLKNGVTYAGVVKSETADEIELNSPEDGLLHLKKSEIESREKGLSGMPEGFGAVISKQDVRNLVEFLATAK